MEERLVFLDILLQNKNLLNQIKFQNTVHKYSDHKNVVNTTTFWKFAIVVEFQFTF